MPARDAMYCALRPPMVNTNSHAQSFVEPPWQMLFSFAGCSVVLEPGDVLWLSADVITQRAGVSSSSLSLRLTTSLPPEMCNESPAARRDDREVRKRVQARLACSGQVGLIPACIALVHETMKPLARPTPSYSFTTSSKALAK